MQDEGPTHAEHAAEQAGLEDDVVARRGLAGIPGIGRYRALRRPVILREDECREVDLFRELEEPSERRGAGLERARPRLHARDVLEATGQRVQELLLLRRRAQEDAGSFHVLAPSSDCARATLAAHATGSRV